MFKNMKTTKNIIIGIAIGVSITSIPTFANTVKSYLLTKVSYPIIVNGEEYVNAELPVLNYEGSTYVPLRAIGDLLGEDVKWNSELGRVEIGVDVVAKDTKGNVVDENISNQPSENYIYFREIMDNHPNYIFDWDDTNKEQQLALFEIKDTNREKPILTNIPYVLIQGRVNVLQKFYKSTMINYLK